MMGLQELLILVPLVVVVVLLVRHLLKRGRARQVGARDEAAAGVEASAAEDTAAPKSIFITYRRQDSGEVVGRIYDRLVGHFGKTRVFKDVDSIPLGVDFREHIGQMVARCDVVLALIGPTWISVSDSQGEKRLDDGRDHVRLELEAALGREVPIVPILVGGAVMPSEADLPASLAALSYRNGMPVRPDPDFHNDMDRLIAGVEHGVDGVS